MASPDMKTIDVLKVILRLVVIKAFQTKYYGTPKASFVKLHVEDQRNVHSPTTMHGRRVHTAQMCKERHVINLNKIQLKSLILVYITLSMFHVLCNFIHFDNCKMLRKSHYKSQNW